MRVHVLGLFGAFALAACGSESAVARTPVPAVTEEVASPEANAEETSPPAPPSAREAKETGPYPILLLHGMAGFEKLDLGPVEVNYFAGVAADLNEKGEDAYVTIAPPYDTSDVRAKVIAKQIDEILARTGKTKVNLIGHSQGGLDARILASPNGLGYADRIASVTTVATPHHGTKIADVVLGLVKNLPKDTLDDILGTVLSVVQRTAYDLDTDSDLRGQLEVLSVKHMKDVFNPKYVDAPGVFYSSYAGRTNRQRGDDVCDGSVYPNQPTKLDSVTPPLLPTALFLEESEGQINDGLIPVESAKWGSFEECVPADHMKEVGLLGEKSSFDHIALFRKIVSRLRAMGF